MRYFSQQRARRTFDVKKAKRKAKEERYKERENELKQECISTDGESENAPISPYRHRRAKPRRPTRSIHSSLWLSADILVSVPSIQYTQKPPERKPEPPKGPDHTQTLPKDTLIHVAKYLSILDMCRLMCVCHLMADTTVGAFYLMRLAELDGPPAKHILRVSHHCPRLKSLHLHGKLSARNVAYTVKNCKNLERVQIVGTVFDSRCEILPQIAKHLPKLRVLQIACREFSSKDLRNLAKNCSELEDLRLWSYSSKTVNDGITEILKRCKNLFRLALFHFMGAGTVFQGLQPLVNLVNLCLHGCCVLDNNCGEIAKAAPKLRSLILSFNWGITDEGMLGFFRENIQLDELRLENTSISTRLVREIARETVCPKIKRLGLPIATLHKAGEIMKAKPQCVVKG